MSAPGSSGSTPQRGAAAPLGASRDDRVKQDADRDSATGRGNDKGSDSSIMMSVSALTTSKLANQNAQRMVQNTGATDAYPMDKLLAKLSEQQAVLNNQNEAFKSGDEDGNANIMYPRNLDLGSSSSSLPMTPATDAFPATAPTTRPASTALDEARPEAEEVLRLKLQLAQAQNHISKLDQELAKSRTAKAEPDLQGIGVPRNVSSISRDTTWMTADDAQSDSSDALSATAFNRARGIWGTSKGAFNNALPAPVSEASPGNWGAGRSFNQGYVEANGTYPNTMECYRGERLAADPDLLMRPSGGRRSNRYDNRLGAPYQFGSGSGGMGAPVNQFESIGGPMPSGTLNAAPGLGPMGMGVYPPYQQQPIGTTLSPHASEFTSKAGWKSEAMPPEGPTYLPATEPLNYRRLLDKNVSANWKYIVDKIVCNNDQQASIFLQQKLKVGSPEQKYEIVEAIVAQAYPLMVNRFGNFLVQRCFEHGTPEQVIKIAGAIRGNTRNLSMDPFGCHVVQKAFDSVPEDYKSIMVRELLRRIPETVIHRYACHVWQKLFELRWTESPPQIMKYVNEALRGMWHEVALGETGSLVVQNIFENCLEEDKRPCIEEVLANIDIVAHGQFGNWCIQHICEHGAPPDRSRAIDHVIRYAAEYSTDQFASKVVEKCLKIGGGDFLGRYLDRVCEGRPDRTRIPLIDIASDQYGNYLVQWILNHATPQHREMVAAHIRKHMVSLRGSKFGSRVGMLCTNHAVTTRPGPGVGPGMGSRMGQGPRFGGAYR
ncbi:pumilio-family RNA binding repeat domain-containing protein [Hirsutella rhossiliensis]|uniref:Pumilio-family RNA binding repeat domain-containing protein n=1 Tax=Hirsutella rhossiliensis TaxID=111463 RepID=A0A9P8SLL4_9HYPO|nr:pumilio-family RNA binding repeat domain-containing protein [Hirsutella rhossiliensis]KAH0967081.1 pumilio-family RNA binding repeat domain-containing protein [Hirsutella rhossiliensis]